MAQKILIASDHAGFSLKEKLKTLLNEYHFEDLGTHTMDAVDYPDLAKKLTEQLLKNPICEGILICGTGVGMSMAANRVPGIRASVVENPVTARLAREHNYANVLCLGARQLAPEYAAEIARVWLETDTDTAERHARRVAKID